MTSPRFLYVSNNGIVACLEHGGGYLKDEIARRPDAKIIVTPLDHWERVVDGSVEDRWTWRCETCERIAVAS